MSDVTKTLAELFYSGKGVWAADASEKTMGERFAQAKIENTVENRRRLREILMGTTGIENYVSGVILNDETIRYRFETKMITGIKVDLGTVEVGQEGRVTEGLSDLKERLTEYRKMGARFAKWRAIFEAGEKSPGEENVAENSRRMGKYARACLDVGLVPIVEPEVLMEGRHGIKDCLEATKRVLERLFLALSAEWAEFERVILKCNMVLPGKESGEKATPKDVAEATTKALLSSVPVEMGGIVFLSGGQEDREATANLNEIVKSGKLPWPVTFSFERALEGGAILTWGGREENKEAAQKEFLKRAKLNSLASQGKYLSEMEER